MKKYGIHFTISAVALLVAGGHLLFPNARIDAVTLALLVIAILPWMGSIFKSVELPGGLKVEYQDLARAEKAAEKAGLLVSAKAPAEQLTYAALADEDPNLALAGLRIELEKGNRSSSWTPSGTSRHRTAIEATAGA